MLINGKKLHLFEHHEKKFTSFSNGDEIWTREFLIMTARKNREAITMKDRREVLRRMEKLELKRRAARRSKLMIAASEATLIELHTS